MTDLDFAINWQGEESEPFEIGWGPADEVIFQLDWFDPTEPGAGGFDGVHNDLDGRDADDAHPTSAVTGLVSALEVAGRSHTVGADLVVVVNHVDGTATTVKILGLSPGAATAGLPEHTTAVFTFASLAAFGAALDGIGGSARVLVPEAVTGADADVAGVYDLTSATLTDPWVAVDPMPDVVMVGGDYVAMRVETDAHGANPHYHPLVSPTFLEGWVARGDAAGEIGYGSAVGLLAGLTQLGDAVDQIEGILDRDCYGPGAYIDADAQALNLATLTTTGGAPTPTYGVAPDGTSATKVFVLGRTDPTEDGIYLVSAGNVWTQGANPDVFVPPGNGYRFICKPGGGDPLMTWEATMDAQQFVDRAGKFSDENGGGWSAQPYTWSLVEGAAGGGAVDSVNGATGTVVLDAGDVGADPAGSAATAQAAAVQRSNHTGTQLMATISDAGALATLSAVASAQITDATIVAGDLATALASRIPTTVRMTSDVGVTSSTTLVDTTGMAVPVTNGQTVTFRAVLRVTGASAGDMKLGVTAPTGTLDVVVLGPSNAFSSMPGNMACHAPITSSGGSIDTLGTLVGNTVTVIVEGTFVATATGTVQIQHAQRSSDVTATTVKAGSTLTYWTT